MAVPELTIKTEANDDDDDYGDAVTVLRRSLSADADARDDSCASGSDSGSQSHDEDAGTTSGSSSTTNVEPSAPRLHATRSRHHGDPDRRARRAIANSNERRRMQSINAGFQSLHDLVKPRHGEKLSKAAILQRAVDYIVDLHRQKSQLVAKNERLVQLLATGTGNSRPEVTSSLPGAAKRRRLESLSSCSCSLSSDDGAVDAPISGPRRRKPEVDRREADQKLEDGVEDLRIASLPLTTATLPVAAQAAIPEATTDATSCGESSRHPLKCEIPSSTERLGPHASVFERSPLTVWNASTSSDSLWSSTSRRNLETILEAIRHLEGDHCQPTNLVSRRDDVGQAASNSLSLAEALMASSNVQLTPSKTCVAVRSS